MILSGKNLQHVWQLLVTIGTHDRPLNSQIESRNRGNSGELLSAHLTSTAHEYLVKQTLTINHFKAQFSLFQVIRHLIHLTVMDFSQHGKQQVQDSATNFSHHNTFQWESEVCSDEASRPNEAISSSNVILAILKALFRTHIFSVKPKIEVLCIFNGNMHD